MTVDDAYQLGLKNGREAAIEELCRFLKLDEKIDAAIKNHEEQMHGDFD